MGGFWGGVIIGAASAVAFIAITRAFGRLEPVLFAAGLLGAAVVYVGFGLAAQALPWAHHAG